MDVEAAKEIIKEKVKAGYGCGKGKAYHSWIKIISGPTKASSHIIQGYTTGRSHEVLSKLERDYCLILDSHPNVVDIREKVPRIDIEMDINNAESIGIKYPVDNKTNIPFILTSDFLIDIKTKNEIKQVIRSVIPKYKLEEKRTLELLELERLYWEKAGISDFKIVTEDEIDEIRADNWKYLTKEYRKLAKILNTEDISIYAQQYLKNLSEDLRISDYSKDFERETGLGENIGKRLFCFSIVERLIIIDLDVPIKLNKTLGELRHGL